MRHDLGRRLFTYAVVTDTHLNQGETECNSPFEVNKLANGRMRHVVRDLNRRDLEFVIHLGESVAWWRPEPGQRGDIGVYRRRRHRTMPHAPAGQFQVHLHPWSSATPT